ncbi:conserved hypothetical protein [Desulfatibacillum aliphaticivorans]|uniref:Uncharacterized protein n=1 Tax=Desulfatibacillum aliphaticivorans TaxID=218208 RepID=B8FAG0_DESAL|nr:hypothetical protein [Desulfatibacillum aliphaticivorans]ACL03256.1 conserved hypothetical protein [Desulfatibacillum aliphaticivorans]
MVQVDVFWAYALGSTFASAAARQLKEEDKPFTSKYFVYNLLFLSCIFAPSGIYLLWNFPDWETMQVARSHLDLQAWLVVIFSVTNITQGILGFWISYKFIRMGKFFAAHMQWFLGYFFMFFILLHGWDGLGWQRFLYDSSVNNGAHWAPGMHMGLGFLTSNVCYTLLGMGLFVVPGLGIPVIRWIAQGAALDATLPKEKSRQNPLMLGVWLLTAIFAVSLLSAGGAGLAVHYIGKLLGSQGLGFIIGLAAFGAAAYFLLFKPQMPGYRVLQQLFIEEPAA